MDINGVNDRADYRWSSHRTYLGVRGRPGWFTTDFFLDWYGGDRTGLDAFVTGSDRCTGLVGTPDEIVAACEFVVAEQSTSRLRSRHAETRSLALSIAAELPTSERDCLHHQLELDGGALKTAQTRARQLMEHHPAL